MLTSLLGRTVKELLCILHLSFSATQPGTMEQIKKKMAQLKRTQEEAEARAKKAEDELAETNAKAQAVS